MGICASLVNEIIYKYFYNIRYLLLLQFCTNLPTSKKLKDSKRIKNRDNKYDCINYNNYIGNKKNVYLI